MKALLKRLAPSCLLDAFRRWRAAWDQKRFQLAASARIKDYLGSHPEPRLHIGCGPYLLEGWLNTDITPHRDSVVYLDCTKPFPLEDGVFDHVFSEHLIEHLPHDQGQFLLREAYRVLRPGGKIRIATPDLRFLFALYGPAKTEVQDRYIAWSALQWPGVGEARDVFVINHFFQAWGHRFIYDPATLQEAMSRAGFAALSTCQPGQSDDHALRGIERHGQAFCEDFNQLETFVLEGQKPRPASRAGSTTSVSAQASPATSSCR